ncbi:MAG: hypothetical protein RSE41_06840 [Clostridia bacterium]
MDFEEFLYAKNRDDLICEIYKAYNNKTTLNDWIHDILINEYKDYLCVGGMPEAINNYILNNCDITKFDRNIHRYIINTYLADMRKYTNNTSETVKIQNIYETMPIQLRKR